MDNTNSVVCRRFVLKNVPRVVRVETGKVENVPRVVKVKMNKEERLKEQGLRYCSFVVSIEKFDKVCRILYQKHIKPNDQFTKWLDEYLAEEEEIK